MQLSVAVSLVDIAHTIPQAVLTRHATKLILLMLKSVEVLMLELMDARLMLQELHVLVIQYWSLHQVE